MSSAYVMPLVVSLCVLAGLLLCLAAFRLSRRVIVEQRRRREAERSLERTSQLEALAAALLKGRTSLEVSEASLAELLPAIGASTAAIALATEDETELAVVHTVGFPETAATPPAVPLAWKTLLTEAWRNQEDVIFASRADHHRSFAHLAADPLFDDCEAAIVLPLLVPGRALGVVALGFPRPHTSSAEERQFLASAAQHHGACARSRRPIRAGAAGTRQCRGVSRAGGYRAPRTAAGGGSASRKRSQVSGARGADEPALHAERRAVRGGQPRGHRQGDRPPGKKGGRGVLRLRRPAGRRRAVRNALHG